VDRLTQALATARTGPVQTDRLIEQARQAFDAGKLDGDDGAGPLYRRVLGADPNNAVAAHGLDKVGDALASQAHKALDAGDRAAASALVDRLAALIPNYGELPALRAALVPVEKQDSADALNQAQEAMRAGRISGDGDDTALAHYKAVLAIDPDNADAKAGLGQVAQALILQANAALDSGDQAQARKLLDQAAELAPHSSDLAAARARLGDTHKASAALPVAGDAADLAGPTQHPVLTPQQSTDLARMIQRADTAAQQGKLMLPPGDSAYDLYRGALAIDGNNETARHGLDMLPSLAMNQFNQALASGNLQVAGDRLADLADLSPGSAGQGELRQRLASAWLDQAEQQLQQGDRASATQSLEQARKLAPGNPRVATLTARLQAGS
jgi:tetratricopeptide (TPR) repeat protein